MFDNSYFAPRYFAPRYFDEHSADPVPDTSARTFMLSPTLGVMGSSAPVIFASALIPVQSRGGGGGGSSYRITDANNQRVTGAGDNRTWS